MRGGRRKGAGRKKIPEEKKKIPKLVCLTPLDWMWIEIQEGSKGQVVERLIEEKRNK